MVLLNLCWISVVQRFQKYFRLEVDGQQNFSLINVPQNMQNPHIDIERRWGLVFLVDSLISLNLNGEARANISLFLQYQTLFLCIKEVLQETLNQSGDFIISREIEHLLLDISLASSYKLELDKSWGSFQKLKKLLTSYCENMTSRSKTVQQECNYSICVETLLQNEVFSEITDGNLFDFIDIAVRSCLKEPKLAVESNHLKELLNEWMLSAKAGAIKSNNGESSSSRRNLKDLEANNEATVLDSILTDDFLLSSFAAHCPSGMKVNRIDIDVAASDEEEEADEEDEAEAEEVVWEARLNYASVKKPSKSRAKKGSRKPSSTRAISLVVADANGSDAVKPVAKKRPSTTRKAERNEVGGAGDSANAAVNDANSGKTVLHWPSVVLRFLNKFEYAFCPSSSKLHNDHVPTHYRVVDGAQSKWGVINLLDGMVSLLKESHFKKCRRQFNQCEELQKCIIEEIANNPQISASIKAKRTGLHPEAMPEFSVSLAAPWRHQNEMKDFLRGVAGTNKSSEKYVYCGDYLLKHGLFAEPRQTFPAVIENIVHRALNVFPLPNVVPHMHRQTSVEDRAQSFVHLMSNKSVLDSPEGNQPQSTARSKRKLKQPVTLVDDVESAQFRIKLRRADVKLEHTDHSHTSLVQQQQSSSLSSSQVITAASGSHLPRHYDLQDMVLAARAVASDDEDDVDGGADSSAVRMAVEMTVDGGIDAVLPMPSVDDDVQAAAAILQSF